MELIIKAKVILKIIFKKKVFNLVKSGYKYFINYYKKFSYKKKDIYNKCS